MARSTRWVIDVLVRWQPGGPLELSRKVVEAEAGDRRHLLQARAGVEVFLDVLEPPRGSTPSPPSQRPAGCHDVPDQVDGQEVGRRYRAEQIGFPRVGPAHSKRNSSRDNPPLKKTAIPQPPLCV